MIEFKNVSYTYANTQTPAVSDINFTVASGELKLVTGASGCGKTTLMRLANGLCPQIYGGRLEGCVTVAGLNVSETPVADLSEVIGTLFQDPEEQFFALNAGDEIAFALRSRSFDPKDVPANLELRNCSRAIFMRCPKDKSRRSVWRLFWRWAPRLLFSMSPVPTWIQKQHKRLLARSWSLKKKVRRFWLWIIASTGSKTLPMPSL